MPVTGDTIRLRVRVMLVLSALALLASAVSAATAQQRAARPGRRGPGPRIGRPAPDFELPLLETTTNKAGETVDRVTDEKVRLSSFRGRKVVCLFLSSYT